MFFEACLEEQGKVRRENCRAHSTLRPVISVGEASHSLDFVGETTSSLLVNDLVGLIFSISVASPGRDEPSVELSSTASIAAFLAAAVTLGLSIETWAEWRWFGIESVLGVGLGAGYRLMLEGWRDRSTEN